MSLVTLEASNESRRIQNLKKILRCQLSNWNIENQYPESQFECAMHNAHCTLCNYDFFHRMMITKAWNMIYNDTPSAFALDIAVFHAVASMLLLFSWCCLYAIILLLMLSHLLLTFLSTTTKGGAAVLKPAQPLDYRFIRDRVYVFCAFERDKSEYEYTLLEEKWVNFTRALLQSSA